MKSSAPQRSTAWWLATLRRRRERQDDEQLDLSQPIQWSSPREKEAAIAFFNAAFRAEESGLRQAHELARELREHDPELAEALELYGNEEGWHRELLTEFLGFLGGGVEPMGRVTGLLYRLYGRAERMETIVLTNLMFETIGSTTYRLALGRVRHPAARQMLTILTRDESFHVPLNVHFLRRVLERRPEADRLRLRAIHDLLFVTLVALPLASRPKAMAFDGLGRLELMRAYARMLASLFVREPDLGLAPPKLVLWMLGVRERDYATPDSALDTSVEGAERAAERSAVAVTALPS